MAAITSLMIIIPVFAQTNGAIAKADAGSTASTRAQKKAAAEQTRAAKRAQAMANTQAKGEKEIDARVASLNKLLARVSEMKKISPADVAGITSMIQNEITALNNLRAQIAADTATGTLKTDVQSITNAYRVYALVIPQIEIVAAADRIVTVAESLNTMATKLQMRMASSTNAAGVASAQATMADLNAKIKDAVSQARAAISEVTGLLPDQGDKTKMAANTAALKDARSKIQTANKDLVAARKDAQSIVDFLRKGMKTTTTVNASSTGARQ